jgi:hypothetical protein
LAVVEVAAVVVMILVTLAATEGKTFLTKFKL